MKKILNDKFMFNLYFTYNQYIEIQKNVRTK